ncbi:hypothetical protein KKF45_03740, partial [Patescibacteria group bacterium]|nr:hypothetical protein [Patescibacteria group bacterium]
TVFRAEQYGQMGQYIPNYRRYFYLQCKCEATGSDETGFSSTKIRTERQRLLERGIPSASDRKIGLRSRFKNHSEPPRLFGVVLRSKGS